MGWRFWLELFLPVLIVAGFFALLGARRWLYLRNHRSKTP